VWSSRKEEFAIYPILKLSNRAVAYTIGIIILMTSTLGYLMGSYTDADLYYFDAFTTSGSLVAQFLLAKKYLQNWLIWIVVDLVAIPVYMYKGLYFFSFLFLVYLLICVSGYIQWKQTFKTIEN